MIIASAPLVTVTGPTAWEAIPNQLAMPLRPPGNRAQQARAHIMAYLMTLELAAERGAEWDSHLQQLDAEIARHRLAPGVTGTAAYLEFEGLAQFFPKLAERLQVPLTALNDIHDYLRQMQLVNQISALAFQLKADIDFINHKYMAHQIALLFAALGQSTIPIFAPFKKRIESEFEAIKASSNAEVEAPQLSQSQKQWLNDLTEEVINLALSLPLELGGDVYNMAQTLQRA